MYPFTYYDQNISKKKKKCQRNILNSTKKQIKQCKETKYISLFRYEFKFHYEIQCYF